MVVFSEIANAAFGAATMEAPGKGADVLAADYLLPVKW
jgi:hypothetical protein